MKASRKKTYLPGPTPSPVGYSQRQFKRVNERSKSQHGGDGVRDNIKTKRRRFNQLIEYENLESLLRDVGLLTSLQGGSKFVIVGEDDNYTGVNHTVEVDGQENWEFHSQLMGDKQLNLNNFVGSVFNFHYRVYCNYIKGNPNFKGFWIFDKTGTIYIFISVKVIRESFGAYASSEEGEFILDANPNDKYVTFPIPTKSMFIMGRANFGSKFQVISKNNDNEFTDYLIKTNLPNSNSVIDFIK